MDKIRIGDIEKHYGLLNHNRQTELRIFSGYGQSYFVSNKEEFVEMVILLNKEEGVHCGVNQRVDFGKKSDQVKTINGFYFDIEGKEHTLNAKCDSFILSIRMFNHLVGEGLKPVLADSGGGYHIFMSLSIPIQVTDETKPLIEKSFKRIKNYYKHIKTKESKDEHTETKESKVDISDVSFCKVERVIGTYNYRHEKYSKWLTDSAITDTSAFLEWINRLPEPKKKRIRKHENVKGDPFGCLIMEHALGNKLPTGERNQVVCPNFMATNPSDEHIQTFARTQDMNIGEIEGWKHCESWEGKFNCPQMRKYAKKHELSYLCGVCISNIKKNKGDIILYENAKGQASCTQARGRLILS